MTRIKQWLIAATLTAACLSSTAHSQTFYDDFLERIQVQQFNTSVLTLPTTSAANTVQMMMGNPATTINLDVNALFSLPDFQIELPGLTNIYAVNENVIENALGGQNWIGDVVSFDPAGFTAQFQGRAYFVETANGITGTIHTIDSVIQIYPDGAGGQVMVSQDPAVFDNEAVIQSAADLGEGQTAASPAIGGRRDGQSPATLDNPYTIDVLWVTTALARENVTDMAALIELATTTGNDVLVNSEVPARFNVVGIHDNATYQEVPTDMMRSIEDLRAINDGNMDEVHALRTELGADMVATVSGATDLCGVGYLDANYSNIFSITGYQCMSSYTPIHELGHNFGAGHDIATNPNRIYSFGQGLYNDTIAPSWRTVMSYPCPGSYCPRIPFYSNAQQTYNDLPLGDPEDFDNARVLRVRVAEVAGFSPSLTSACTEHTSSNSAHVSAGRAYTETVYYSTKYFAEGSDEALSGYSFSTTTLAELPAGYFSVGNCTATTSETPFAPEVQNLNPTPITGGLRLAGEVFDANADTITRVNARVTGESAWVNGNVTGNTFSMEIPATLSGSVSIDIQTEDSNGDTFEFTTTFDLDVGEAPSITLRNTDVIDDSARINGNTYDPDNSVYDFFYQLNGDGDPDTGTWTSYTVNSISWSLDIENLSPGSHIIHVYGVDETAQRSNVVNASVEILPLEAPFCLFAGAAPSTSRNAGEVDIMGITEDVNHSDVRLEYRINSGSWIEGGTYNNLETRNQFAFPLPNTFADGANLTIEMRAIDSSDLETHCGTQTIVIDYPTEDIAPTCKIVDVTQYDGLLRFYMAAFDPNGDIQNMYGKTSISSEWVATWPGAITTHLTTIPGFGDVTVQGRVADSTGLEAVCDATYTVVDQQIAPEITSSSGYYDAQSNTAVGHAQVIDTDGDLISVEFRQAGTTAWVAGIVRADDDWKRSWDIDFGSLPNGDYTYQVRATDAGGRVSDVVDFSFNVTAPLPPTLDSLSHELQGRTLVVNGVKSDPDNNDHRVMYRLNEEEWVIIWGTDDNFSFLFTELPNGQHSVEVYVEDTDSLRSDSQFINIEIDEGQAPVITQVTYDVVGDQVNFSISATDAEGGQLGMRSAYDGQSNATIWSYTYQWDVTWLDVSAGSHTASFDLTDGLNNRSETITVNFDIVEQTPCFEDTNANHAATGRAYIETQGQTCYGTFCFGGTDTYFATGSGNNMGTSASTSIDLDETSTGYFEIGTCSTVDTTAPIITLNGSSPMSVTIGTTFVDPGATASDNVDGNISANIFVNGSVNTAVAGSYQLTYNVSDAAGNSANQTTRTVNVEADSVAPVITLIGNASMAVNVGGSFVDPGATASDNVDGDISANITVNGSVNTAVAGSYQLTYNVSDAAGNAASQVIRTVNVTSDAIAPIITLTGSATMSVNVGGSFVDPGATASDNVDGDITSSIIVSGSVNTAAIGSYVLNYNVSDIAGNAATQVSRTVNVVAASSCFTSTLADHATAGRAYTQYSLYYATGTATYLGSTYTNANTIASLEETTPGNWDSVGSCN